MAACRVISLISCQVGDFASRDAAQVYDLEENDAIYQYTERWDLWDAIKQRAKRYQPH